MLCENPQKYKELQQQIKEFDCQKQKEKNIKKVIYKPINNQRGTHFTQILLQPNGNLIHGTFSKKDIPLNKRNKIIFIRDPWIDYKIIKQKLETGSQDYLYFSGELDQKLQPYLEGYYRGENQEIHATFQDGFSNKIQLYQSGNQYEIEKPDLNNSAICSDKDQMITLPTFRTCLEGRWLNQKVVDFYLDFAQLYLKLTKQNANIYKNYIINTCNSQDIFSSDIFEARNFSKESWEKYHEMNRIDLNDTSNRYIFATNIRKSHFVVFVLEWNQNEYQPILIDSLPSQYLGNDKETRIIKEVFSYIVKKPIGNLKRLEAPKQQNAYDCGVHSIYNSIKIFRNSTDPVENIKLNIKPDTISQLRRHIYQVMVNNYAHLLKYYYEI